MSAMDGEPIWPGPDDEMVEMANRCQEAEARLKAAMDALEVADKEASVAHDAIWSKEVAPAAILHDNKRTDSAQSAIWRLHEKVRAALAATSPESGGGES